MPMDFQDGNFIERFRQEPADISGIPGGTPDAALDDLNHAPSGEPAVDFDVRSIYDSRPINGYDFNVAGSAAYAFPSSTVVVISFTVPTNFVMVPRALHHWTNPVIGLSREDILLDVRVNNSSVPQNIDIPVGGASDELVKLFFIADERSLVQLVFKPQVQFPNSTFWAHLYGNLLLKTNRPANFEIANPVGRQHKSSRGPTFSVSDAPLPTPSGAPVQIAPPVIVTPAPISLSNDQVICVWLTNRASLSAQDELRGRQLFSALSVAGKQQYMQRCGAGGMSTHR